MRVELHPEARAELRAAAVWYDEQRPGLGDQLVAEVSSTLERIVEAPASFPRWPDVPASPTPIHRAVMKRFPYVIAFEVHSQHVLVLAVAHSKRRPLYWLARAY
ncbi:MAG: type II toxin-antitoxin system RelE/ParE family toxin [Polyangiaceae bacterium]|nr:type II toxin-antitoxin system RelE/ParE family toxin [Polyangiaceae bacterium]